MSFSWSDLYEQGKDKLEAAFQDVVSVGVPALQASAEQYAIDLLKKQNERTQAELRENLGELVERPSEQGSFGEAVRNQIQGSFLEQYGLHIAVGAGALILVGMYLRGK